MSRNTVVVLLVAVLLIGLGGFLLVGDDDNAENSNTSTTQTAENQSQANTQQVSSEMLASGLKAKQAEFESKNPQYPDPGGEKVLYQVNADGTTTPELHPADAELWDMVKTLAPSEEVFKTISVFEVYFNEEDTTLASIESQNDTNSSWLYSINYISVTDFEELAATMLHEFAHILSFQNSQTTTEAEQADIRTVCTNYLIAEGCLNDGSFLGEFFNQFWKNDSALKGDEDNTEAETDEVFANRPDDFVTAYSITNPTEDFAETFMFYAIKEPVQPGTLKAEKTQFFDKFSELVNYRQQARKDISAWANS